MTGAVPYKKGDLVKAAIPPGARTAGDYRLIRVYNNNTVPYVRYLTDEERDARRRSVLYQGLNSAGEIPLIPYVKHGELEVGTYLLVVRARVRCPSNWGNSHPGYTLVLDTKTGHEIYIERCYLEPVK